MAFFGGNTTGFGRKGSKVLKGPKVPLKLRFFYPLKNDLIVVNAYWSLEASDYIAGERNLQKYVIGSFFFRFFPAKSTGLSLLT